MDSMEKDLEKGDMELARPESAHVAEHKTKRFSLARPPPPPEKDEPRPMTSSTKRLSFSTNATRKPIKYGTGRHATTELSPSPSDDPDDPLNWAQWRKELNLAALLVTVGLIGGMKTAFITVNSVLAIQFNVSYTAIASLTAVPLVISAFTGFLSLVISKVWGKRPVYLVSMILVFIGAMWNMQAGDSFGQCMGARVFQGLGWGAFDTLILSSIHDTYFEHERHLRIAAYNVISIATTWGPPILGGLASQNANRFTLQFEIINFFQIVAVPLIAFGAAETAFDRWFSAGGSSTLATPASVWMSLPLRPRGKISVESTKEYLRKMKPWEFEGMLDQRTLLQAPRAFVAPTTSLLVLATFLPYGALWGFTQSLSLLFSPMPWILTPSDMGYLMAGPFVGAFLAILGFAAYRKYYATFTPRINILTIGSGTVLVSVGILTFGLKVQTTMTELPANFDGSTSIYATDFVGSRLSFPLLSILLAFLTIGTYVIDATVRPLIWRSTQFTSSNLNVCLRNVADMDAGVTCWRTLFSGVFVMAIPSAIFWWDGLKATVIGIGVTQILIGCAVSGIWYFYDEHIRRIDGKVMGLVDLSMLKQTGSFFDLD